MGLRLIRGNSDTPNVTNADDARMVRYAYGGYNGFVQGKGRELHCEGNGDTLTINSGVIVLQGWEVEIDSNGWSMQVSGTDATKRYFTVYCEVNLSMGGTVSIKSTMDTVNYPKVEEGNDLTKITNGIARLELCHFTARSGVISGISKVIQRIPYESDEMDYYIKKGNVVPNYSQNSLKINGLNLIRDKNGILKIDDIIIPQRKRIWEGKKEVNYENPMEIEPAYNHPDYKKTIEIEWEDPSENYVRNISKFHINIGLPMHRAEKLIRTNRWLCLGFHQKYWDMSTNKFSLCVWSESSNSNDKIAIFSITEIIE